MFSFWVEVAVSQVCALVRIELYKICAPYPSKRHHNFSKRTALLSGGTE